jgi:hypothetical protein
MKTLFLAFTVTAAAMFATSAAGAGYVRGHVTKNGTYVAPHYRSSPNSTRSDNYSTKGNYNPYTGQAGTRDPYATPAPKKSATPNYWSQPAPSYTPTHSSSSQGDSDNGDDD